MRDRPSVAVWKLASCDGCQLSLLDCEEELLAVASKVRLAHFPEMSRASQGGPYDLSLVEGSVTTAADAERLQEIRSLSKSLVAIGACATAGGIQALRNYADTGEYVRTVYAHPEYISTLDRATPVSSVVPVDLELHGCPVDRHQLLEVITALLAGRRPVLPDYSVCEDCKSSSVVCVLVSAGAPCLGPATRSGCGALCPRVGRPCYGCFGPAESANTKALARRLVELGASEGDVSRMFRTFNAADPVFEEESLAHDSRKR